MIITNGQPFRAVPRRAMTSQDLEEALALRSKNLCWVVSLFLLTSSPGILNAMHINSYVFLAELPTYSWCKIPALANTNWTGEEIRQISSPSPEAQENCVMYDWNYTMLSNLSFPEALNYTSTHEKPSETTCRWGYSYIEEMSSITTEWDLVCDNTPLRSTVQVAVAVGKFAGSFCFAMLADKFGRRVIFLLCCVLYMIAAPAVAMSPYYYFMLAMRLAVGVAGAGVYEVGYTILSEMTLTKHRAVLGCLYNISYAVGITVLPLLAYFSTSWGMLQWCMSFPGFLLLIHCWFMPESPRWLLNHKRYKEALKVLYGSKIPEGVSVPQEDDDSKAERAAKCNHLWYKKVFSSIMKLFQLFSSAELISRISLCHLGWFTASFSYFMIALNGDNFHFNKYLYIALNGIFEAPGYLLPIFMNYRLGRKSSCVILYSIAGFALLIILALPKGAPVVTVALIGRLCSAAMFAEIILYTSELFPTCVRNTAIGTSLTQAQVGTIAAPFVVDILGQKAWYFPSTLCGILCVFTAASILVLPETKNYPFPDTMEDIKNAPPEQKVSFRRCCTFR
uniref:Major facilitator superfamily (MFS) profile domain-containing protein n=1 Tax=Lygus hesperus TaxID=30085 RepID=A0A0K8SDZ9_LYGHE